MATTLLKLTGSQKVVGSNPISSTNKKKLALFFPFTPDDSPDIESQ